MTKEHAKIILERLSHMKEGSIHKIAMYQQMILGRWEIGGMELKDAVDRAKKWMVRNARKR